MKLSDIEEVAKLKVEERELTRLSALAGAAAGILQRGIELDLLASFIEAQGVPELMSVAQVLRDAAAAAKQGAEDIKTAIDSAIARLSDNPTAADIQAAIDDLNAANATNAASLAALPTIDPDATSGGVVDDGSGGVTEAPPSE